MTTFNAAQASLLAQAKDRCYPGVLDSYWTATLADLGFEVADYPTLADMRQAIADALQNN
jgi:hypothetical protein